MMRRVIAGFLFVVLFQTAAEAKTERTYNPLGGGYKDTITTDDGTFAGETQYDDYGVPQKSREVDADNGSTTDIEYKDGKIERKTIKDRDGRERLREDYDEEGRVTERSSTTEEGISEDTIWQYDEEGRVVTVWRRTPGSGMDEKTFYTYDPETGKLVVARRLTTQISPPGEIEDLLEFDANGEVIRKKGSTGDLLDDLKPKPLPSPVSPETHETQRGGHRVRVKHNRDGTYEVWVYDKDGRLIDRQHLRPGPCYLGDDCPHGPRRSPAKSTRL